MERIWGRPDMDGCLSGRIRRRRRVGKGVGTVLLRGDSYRAPCPRVLASGACDAWALRTMGFLRDEAVLAPLPTLRHQPASANPTNCASFSGSARSAAEAPS